MVITGALVACASSGPSTGVSTASAEVTQPPVHSLSMPVVSIHTGTVDLAAAAALEETERGAKIRLDSTLLFGKDSAVLRPAAARRLAQVAEEIHVRGPGRLAVVGYTDDLGTRAHGLILSKRRAGAVAGFLEEALPRRGDSFTTGGMGEASPIVPNSSEANRRKSRRVLVTYVNDG